MKNHQLLWALVLLTVLNLTVACGASSQQAGSNTTLPARTSITDVTASSITPPTGALSQQGDAWGQVRSVLPADVAVYKPTFVPDRFGSPTLLEARIDKENGPLYTVNYRAQQENLVFILGLGKGAFGNAAPPDTSEPITINDLQGVLMKSSTGSPSFGVSWQERGKSYEIKAYSQRMTHDELLQIVKSLVPVEPSK